MFYQPSDQGYERGIRDQVARRREAQLAAMVEEETQPEILTFAPGGRAHDRWLQRAVGNAGQRLGRLRDRVLDAAALQRHHVVLDLNAGSGLLTWEILRRTPEGGTWALVRDRQAATGLRQQVEQLPQLERPVILAGQPAELPSLLGLRGEGDLRFDAVVGRNALGPLPDKTATIHELVARLRPGGRLSLAEVVSKHTQRLYDLLDLSSLDSDLQERLIAAEEAIYAQAGDPWVNWNAGDLQAVLEAAGLVGVASEQEVQTAERLVSPETVARWFAPDTDSERPTYAQHLLQRISPKELAAVQALFERQLAGQAVPWRTHLLLLSGQAPNPQPP
jgi:putative ATPase